MLYLVMQIEGARYALDIKRVVEVLPMVILQDMPRAPRGVVGMIDYGGAPVPVIDLSIILANRPAHRRFNTRIVMVRATTAADSRLIALVAERATETMRREPTDFRDPGVKSASPPDVWPVALDPEGPVYCMEVSRLLPESLAGSLVELAESA
jgi:chemotaxis-related protein WspB